MKFQIILEPLVLIDFYFYVFGKCFLLEIFFFIIIFVFFSVLSFFVGDVIEIVTPVRIFYLVCKTEDTDEWISAIQSWIGDKTNSKV